jgi:uncharacterized phosphatase
MKQLYFVRHGLSELNVAGLYAGHTETPLTDEGRAQAKEAGREAKSLHIDLIVSSPLSRAHETAKIIAKEIGYPVDKIVTNHLFIERFYGELEGKSYDPDLDLDGIADMENDDALIERAREALVWLKLQRADNILVASHGSFGRAFRYLHLPEIDFATKIANAELIRLI